MSADGQFVLQRTADGWIMHHALARRIRRAL